MKKILFLVLCISGLLVGCKSVVKETFLIGTYTKSSSEGINIVEFDDKSKYLELQQVISNIENPSFVISSKNKSIVVAVGETEGKKGGFVTTFSYDKRSNSFKKISSLNTLGNHPCTVAFSPDEKFVIVGNYSGGSLTVFPIDNKGKLSENISFIQYIGKSVNTERQEKPHVHCVVFHPTEYKIFSTDLGTDAIRAIPFDETSNTFLVKDKETEYKVAPGSGPRHLVWNKKGTKLYVTFELTNEVAFFDYVNGELKLLQTISLTKPTKSGSTAELRLSKDERFLYASVRGKDNKLVVMMVNENNSLEIIQEIATEDTPRNFIITTNQKNVLVANQKSNSIVVYNRDNNSGLLTVTQNKVSIPQPVYIFPFE